MIRYVDLFCGIGGFRIAAEKVFQNMETQGNCVFSCDFDKYVQDSYEANFGERPFGDIAKLDEHTLPDFDILFAGFPCQPFSIIGQMKGFEDARGTLFFDIARILKAKKPTCFILENVKQLSSHQNGKTLKIILSILSSLGYWSEYKILNALNFGLPQKRERIFIVGFNRQINFNWPDGNGEYKPLSEILETEVETRHYASEKIIADRIKKHKSEYEPSIWHENKSGNISSYPYSCALRAEASYNYLLVNGVRRLTPREALRLQGFPDSFKIVVSESQIRKQIGNAVPVNLVEAVFKNLLQHILAEK